MNPAALKANLRDLPRGRHGHRQHRRVHQAQPGEGRLRGQPDRRRQPGGVPGAPGEADLADRRGGREGRAEPEGRRAVEEHVRPRPAVLAVPPAARGHPAVPGDQVRRQAGDPAGQPGGARGRLVLRRDHRGLRRPLRGQAGRAAGRAGTATSAATRRWPTAWSPRPSASGLPLFLGSYPITPASDILHELSALKHFGVRTFQAEDEIAGVAAALGASYGGASG